MGRTLYKEDDELVQIHTTLTIQEKREIKECNWEFNELIRLGVLAKRDNPQLIKRIQLLEEEMKTRGEQIRRTEINMEAKFKNIEKKIDEIKVDKTT